MGTKPVITGYGCFWHRHPPSVSSEATWAVTSDYPQAQLLYACRSHVPMALDRVVEDEAKKGHERIARAWPLPHSPEGRRGE